MSDMAREIIATLEEDMQDRSGLRQALDGIDNETRDDMLEEWERRIDDELGQAASDSERPYWMWHAALDELGERPCRRRDGLASCAESTDCITEWCLPCAARAFLASEALARHGR